MNSLIFLFEISDKVISIQMMYGLFLTLGGIGLLLSFWRVWLSICWLIFPMIFVTFLFISLQIEEINYLKNDIIKELGENYIWHNFASVIWGLLLNLIGIFIGIYKKNNLKLR